MVVVQDDIWDICQAPLHTRLHRSLVGEKALTNLCTPFDLDTWVRDALERARAGRIEEDERQKLYRHLLSDDLSLSRSVVAALRQSPVLQSERGAWVAAVDMVVLPPAQAQLLANSIHAPAKAVLKRPKLLAALRLRDRLTSNDIVDFAAHIAEEPGKAAAFEALLKANIQILTPGVVKRLWVLPFLLSRCCDLTAPRDLLIDNEVNRICAASDGRIVAGRNQTLYVRLRCLKRPSAVVMLQALKELSEAGRAPDDVTPF